ncbi:hypothetical protein Rumeso_00454 [Rubellimicrobium mesophilum DSM 19309]|uniref:Uncharacterized protein n=1 Tax=Rubellimicrobium mesophilum DSM 19309 TaxID=442562 RepID=A0A017HV20_9RHOB|nr:hypothetical protein [Rubellimicrobium mesophilum]EYD77993.1 hypothetical protein Rumeso_00454 [Rubellimicrobium mesophilum DSM 19309]
MSQTTFDQRVSKIDDKHRLLSEGATYRVGPDGLIVAVPQRRFVPRFPMRGLALLLGGTFVFKAALLVASGEGTYHGRLSELAKGQPVERVMAWVMQPDPVTRLIARGMDMVVHAGVAERS